MGVELTCCGFPVLWCSAWGFLAFWKALRHRHVGLGILGATVLFLNAAIVVYGVLRASRSRPGNFDDNAAGLARFGDFVDFCVIAGSIECVLLIAIWGIMIALAAQPRHGLQEEPGLLPAERENCVEGLETDRRWTDT